MQHYYDAVRTTGIFCRPGCGARPDPANVTRYAYAAAAEADGYRACLRCRPYRTEPPLRWIGPKLLSRAVQLIVDGALDGNTEGDLAGRLGVSARHLRRMFVEHVGATPDQLARSRRAHFARRLLDDTDLAVTDVAFAAGFGSVRQLNRDFHRLFQATPSELRAKRRADDRIAADRGLALRLPFQGPFDHAAVLGHLADQAIPGVEHVDGDTYRRSVVVDRQPGAIELAPGGSDHMVLRVHLPHWHGLIHVVRQARRVLGLDQDTAGPVRHLSADPVLGALARHSEGVRLPGSWDPYEIGVQAILAQDSSAAATRHMTARLVTHFATPAPGLSVLGLTYLFPPPERLAAADLTPLGASTSRAVALRAYAEAVATGRLRFDRSIGLDELVGTMSALPGVGTSAAHYVGVRLGEPDAFPLTDRALRRSVEQLTGQDANPTALAALAEAWRPWRAHAALWLWLHAGRMSEPPARRALAGAT